MDFDANFVNIWQSFRVYQLFRVLYGGPAIQNQKQGKRRFLWEFNSDEAKKKKNRSGSWFNFKSFAFIKLNSHLFSSLPILTFLIRWDNDWFELVASFPLSVCYSERIVIGTVLEFCRRLKHFFFFCADASALFHFNNFDAQKLERLKSLHRRKLKINPIITFRNSALVNGLVCDSEFVWFVSGRCVVIFVVNWFENIICSMLLLFDDEVCEWIARWYGEIAGEQIVVLAVSINPCIRFDICLLSLLFDDIILSIFFIHSNFVQFHFIKSFPPIENWIFHKQKVFKNPPQKIRNSQQKRYFWIQNENFADEKKNKSCFIADLECQRSEHGIIPGHETQSPNTRLRLKLLRMKMPSTSTDPSTDHTTVCAYCVLCGGFSFFATLSCILFLPSFDTFLILIQHCVHTWFQWEYFLSIFRLWSISKSIETSLSSWDPFRYVLLLPILQ